MHSFGQDLAFAVRQLRESPGFAITAVLTLALGIGANTAVFSVINAVLLKPLPFSNADRLRFIWSSSPSQGLAQYGSAMPDYRAWKAENHSFEDMGAFSNGSVNMALPGQPAEELISARITASLFPTVGVEPILAAISPRRAKSGAATMKRSSVTDSGSGRLHRTATSSASRFILAASHTPLSV